jgi:hypothetical protein
LVVEVTGDAATDQNPADQQRFSALTAALKQEPEWQFHLILNRGAPPPSIRTVPDGEILELLDTVSAVATVDAKAALVMGWAAMEALGRNRVPARFGRAQTSAALIEYIAFEGIVGPADAQFLRLVASKRNAVAHGDLSQAVTGEEVARLVALLRELIASWAAEQELTPEVA